MNILLLLIYFVKLLKLVSIYIFTGRIWEHEFHSSLGREIWTHVVLDQRKSNLAAVGGGVGGRDARAMHQCRGSTTSYWMSVIQVRTERMKSIQDILPPLFPLLTFPLFLISFLPNNLLSPFIKKYTYHRIFVKCGNVKVIFYIFSVF